MEFIGHGKEFGFDSENSGRPLEDFQKECNSSDCALRRFMFAEWTMDCKWPRMETERLVKRQLLLYKGQIM